MKQVSYSGKYSLVANRAHHSHLSFVVGLNNLCSLARHQNFKLALFAQHCQYMQRITYEELNFDVFKSFSKMSSAYQIIQVQVLTNHGVKSSSTILVPQF